MTTFEPDWDDPAFAKWADEYLTTWENERKDTLYELRFMYKKEFLTSPQPQARINAATSAFTLQQAMEELGWTNV